MALLLMRIPRSSYAHLKTYPSNARTLSTPVMVVVYTYSVLVRTVYTAPGKAVARTSPISNAHCVSTLHGGDPSSTKTVKVAMYTYKGTLQRKAFTYVPTNALICTCTDMNRDVDTHKDY